MSSLLTNRSYLSTCRTGPEIPYRLYVLSFPSTGIHATPLPRFKRIITTSVCI